jgi:hypothetical protein
MLYGPVGHEPVVAGKGELAPAATGVTVQRRYPDGGARLDGEQSLRESDQGDASRERPPRQELGGAGHTQRRPCRPQSGTQHLLRQARRLFGARKDLLDVEMGDETSGVVSCQHHRADVGVRISAAREREQTHDDLAVHQGGRRIGQGSDQDVAALLDCDGSGHGSAFQAEEKSAASEAPLRERHIANGLENMRSTCE